VHNEGHRLKETVLAVRYAADVPYEVIVVDDVSTDGCAEFLAGQPFDNVRLLRSTSPLGVAGARNRGSREARAPMVMFMDGHCYPEPGFLSRLVLALRKLGRGTVVPQIEHHGHPGASGFGMTLSGPDLGAVWLSQAGAEPYPVPIGCGCVQLFYHSWFDQIGGYDTMRTYGVEDLEISVRSWRMGGPVHVVPRSLVAHHFRQQTTCKVGWTDVVYNVLRMAHLHFSGTRLERIERHWQGHANYAEARRLLDWSDLGQLRKSMEQRWRRSGDWYCEAFQIPI
jgi:polypeptide N-acetylgalactosaminyltransferase